MHYLSNGVNAQQPQQLRPAAKDRKKKKVKATTTQLVAPQDAELSGGAATKGESDVIVNSTKHSGHSTD